MALARAVAKRTCSAVARRTAVEASRGHGRRVRGEVVEWVATRPSMPGPCPRPARAVALSPKEAPSSSGSVGKFISRFTRTNRAACSVSLFLVSRIF